jgi:hypothetical protein
MLMREYVIVENAGYEGETDITGFRTYREALRYLHDNYDPDEIESLSVSIRRDDPDGEREYV